MTDRDSVTRDDDTTTHAEQRKVARKRREVTLPSRNEASYVSDSPEPALGLGARPTPGMSPAVLPTLAAPRTAPISEKKYRQAVDLLASMIAEAVARARFERIDTPQPSPSPDRPTKPED
ncbi:hypothetical protein [Cryptosporangium phraense]|uniref:Uncharacterized protein n=1 Tax=Cryptosporangium phraense TaxID=2593070 RepID=A0A545ANF1_9ACTN|nr:hypothetical protein [Cryptosporangium phraense]TQS42862.1 hypothetical protein FL583_22700 [Cryptosporangium phraense]